MRSNRYAGTCARCGQHVEAETGECRLEANGWRVYCAVQCELQPRTIKSPTIQAKVGDLSGIMALFAKAQSHLKAPAIVLDVPDVPGLVMRVNIAGPRAREPGSLTVLSEERNPVTGRRVHLGTIGKAGWWRPKSAPNLDAVFARLREFAADPAGVAGNYGRLNGRCCFCRIKLSDERSTAVGYGRKCAEHFGLDWGDRPDEFAAGPAPKWRAA